MTLASLNILSEGNLSQIPQVEIQFQVLVVHASVSSASNFSRTEPLKQGNTSGLTD